MKPKDPNSPPQIMSKDEVEDLVGEVEDSLILLNGFADENNKDSVLKGKEILQDMKRLADSLQAQREELEKEMERSASVLKACKTIREKFSLGFTPEDAALFVEDIESIYVR